MDNAEVAWDAFDSNAYFTHNYVHIRADDSRVVALLRDFFAGLDLDADRARGLDVGTGTNLYPALALLPWVRELTLIEHASPNVAWLRREVLCFREAWEPFWAILREHPAYSAISAPRRVLCDRSIVKQGSVFDLEANSCDLGTMFFVAESISSDRKEFEAATVSFLQALRPGAAFAAAFMENSEGYDVGRRNYPAVKVDEDVVRALLDPHVTRLQVHREGVGDTPLRSGYTGMLIVLGFV